MVRGLAKYSARLDVLACKSYSYTLSVVATTGQAEDIQGLFLKQIQALDKSITYRRVCSAMYRGAFPEYC